ncbi:hypothetical protein KDA_00890 [Dictyobacter alpinus]|uniref:Uncharacterized protein n=1 Tax=Dictyobacter alpinus TaxID=2014873 RepID=A0A402AZU5_9CHLR|nr:hypothetical protein KDA_00890 [Dictyobacter alpinus]
MKNKSNSESSDQNTDQLTNKQQNVHTKKNYPQAKWQDVHVPVSKNKHENKSTPPAAVTAITQSSVDIPHKIILSLLAIALTFTIWWCRRLFFKS